MSFCDWYLELIKPVLNGTNEASIAETRATAAWVLDQILIMLHPFMPFVTEELWDKTGGEGLLMNASWPDYEPVGDEAASAEVDWLTRFITDVRSVRSEMNVPANAKVPCVITGANAETRRRAAQWETELAQLARLESVTFTDEVPEGAAQIVVDEATIALSLAGVVDFAGELARLEKELEKIARDMGQIQGRLDNEGFVSKAPAHVIAESKERVAELAARRDKVNEAVERLKAAS